MIINTQQILSGMQFFVELLAEVEALRQQNKPENKQQVNTEVTEQKSEVQ
ncbi:MAG: hypothetical protein V7L26_30050 [Nostoc sp.]